MKLVILLIVALVLIADIKCDQVDYYSLLGISRNADNREIRRAFKKLAITMHPDKNKDKDADTKFIQITRAYEVLKNPDTRKHYDLHGTDPLDNTANQKYESYSYYKNEFGIYDDDPLIVTLGHVDFELNVGGSKTAWFINFYSPRCSHCHTLAPVWRKLSSELEGVVRIAAVNCHEDWNLCIQLDVRSYPSLLYYEPEANIYDGEKYQGSRTVEDLQKYVLNRLTAQVHEISASQWNAEEQKRQNWLLFLCGDDEENCPQPDTRLKLAAMLDGLTFVGVITDSKLCKEMEADYKDNPTIFWQADDNEVEDFVISSTVHKLAGSDGQEIANEVLKLLPDPEQLDEAKFQNIRSQLRSEGSKPWLLCFHLGAATELNLQIKRLPALLPHMHIGLVHCARSAQLCTTLHVSKYPSWGVLKTGGAFEMHHGRDALHEIVAFARESGHATNFHALSPADMNVLLQEGSTWFIDWFAPWCPPCRRIMPELRRASQHFAPESVKFGTIDCTLHSSLCMQHGIRSYPTTALYNESRVYHFRGRPQEDAIVEFIKDLLNPFVISLNERTFRLRLENKPADELWLLDFFAPWCGPCQQLAPEWRNFAKQISYLKQVKVAEVDCETEHDLCSSQGVRGYPTIRIYPLGSNGLSTVALYNGYRDAQNLKKWLFNFLPSPVKELGLSIFRQEIASGPTLVDFYAPWCGHCHSFEPEFITVAQKLKGVVKSAKINCDYERGLCMEQKVSAYPTVRLYFSLTEYYEINSQVGSEIINKVKVILAEWKPVHDEF